MPDAVAELLPLFPLGLVLFPGAALELNIFEERYKVMVSRCADSNHQFGVIQEGLVKAPTAGCTARIVSVGQPSTEGSFQISTVGVRRFRVRALVPGREPYLLGKVAYFEDKPEGVAALEEVEELKLDCLGVYRALFAGNPGGLSDKQIESASPTDVSFLIGFHAGLTLEEKQGLLENRSTRDRLSMELASLQVREADLADARRRAGIRQGNGYFPAHPQQR